MIIADYKEIDGIKVFKDNIDSDHEDYNSKGLDNLYKQEEKHFWFIARKEFILSRFKKYIAKESNVIEIGAGTGNISRFLKLNGYNNISAGEMHLNGLKYAKNYGIQNCYQFDLLEMPFENEFDTVCMFDVLEHIKDDEFALKNVYKSLKEDGTIVLTVPAHMWLWNRDDAIAGHKIRYNKKNLVEKVKNSGFEIIEARYFFITIIPLLWLRTLLNKDNKTKIKKEEFNNDISMNTIISKILLTITRIENKLLDFLSNVCGGSLFVVAEKKTQKIISMETYNEKG